MSRLRERVQSMKDNGWRLCVCRCVERERELDFYAK